MRKQNNWPSMLIVTALLLCGCAREWDIERPVIGTIKSTCVETAHPSAVSQPGASSIALGGRTIWIFGETLLAQPNPSGEGSVSNTAAWVDNGSAACAGNFEYNTDTGGDLAQLIPFTAAELAFNAGSTSGLYRIWPTGGFAVAGVGYVYYDKVLSRGFLDVTYIGSGVAQIDPDGTTTRLTPGVYNGEPTLSWLAPRYGWGTGALVAEDGYVYVFRTSPVGALGWEARVARVDAASIGDPSAYRYWTGLDWSDDESRADVVITGANELSVAYNAFDRRYIAMYSPPLSNEVLMRTAEQPWGPWESALHLFDGVAPRNFTAGTVRQHPAYADEGDRNILVSYFSDPVNAATGLYLVTLDLGDI